MKKHPISALGATALVLCALASPAKANLFQVSELLVPNAQSSSVAAINNQGAAVGNATTSDGVTHAILWSGATATDLGTWNGSTVTPVAVNDAGEIAGFAVGGPGGTHALVWRGSGWVDLGRGYTQGLNASGQVVGYDQDATLWSDTTAMGLGHGIAAGINDAGVIVGYRSTATGSPIAVVWHDGVPTDLAQYSAAYAINNAGNIVGESRSATGLSQATLWTAQGKSLLGTLLDGGHTAAFDINEADQVVGYGNSGALLWVGQEQVDLNAVLANAPGGQFHLMMATGINDSGEIAAFGVDANNYLRAYLLTPVPEPATTTLVLGGLCLLTFARRRAIR